MKSIHSSIHGVLALFGVSAACVGSISAAPPPKKADPDAVQAAQTTRPVADQRPEQKLSPHDQSDAFKAANASPSSTVLKTQPDEGKVRGFDFARDPLNAKKPMQTPEEITAEDKAMKPKVMEAQKRLLEKRYDRTPKLDPEAKMSRGKPLPVGPTARLTPGTTWEDLAKLKPQQKEKDGNFPYPPLPHPKHATGGQVFPAMQIEMFPRLQRFDVDFDLPDAFLPEFPPAIFLQQRPELGDVSRGQVASINNYYALFKDILTPVQLDGLRLLLTPFPPEHHELADIRGPLRLRGQPYAVDGIFPRGRSF